MNIYRRILVTAVFVCVFSAYSCSSVYAAEKTDDYRKVFDADYYYDNNPDLQEVIGKDPEALFQHFVNSGIKEGRSGNEEFNLKAYVFYNQDLLNVFKRDWQAYCRHYVTVGKSEGRISQKQENGDNLIGSYTTYYDSTIPRAVNVELASQRINGVILQPGEMISYSKQILPRTSANGYVVAPVIRGMGYGGGICQVSSTLYAAMCHAMMPAVERYPHSEAVPYMPVGLDAAIASGYKDLKIQNIYSKPLQIVSCADNGKLTVSLYLGEGTGDSGKVFADGNKEKIEKETWKSDENGWWILCPDGSYLKDCWYQSPESGNWYYLGSDGYMLTRTMTPDGYYVNDNGVYVEEPGPGTE